MLARLVNGEFYRPVDGAGIECARAGIPRGGKSKNVYRRLRVHLIAERQRRQSDWLAFHELRQSVDTHSLRAAQ